MISFNNMAAPQDVETLARLVELMADPAKASARIAEYQMAASNLRAEIERMRTASEAFAVEEKRHAAALEEAASASAARLEQAQKAFDAKVQERDVALSARERRLTDLESKAEAAAAANAELRADLERRLALLKAAASAA